MKFSDPMASKEIRIILKNQEGPWYFEQQFLGWN